MNITKIGLSACAVAALLAGTTACTDEGAGTAERAAHQSGAACTGGAYTWFDIDARDVLTGVAEKQKLGKGGGALTHELSPLHAPVTAVIFEKGPRVDPGAALGSLGTRIGETDAAEGVVHEFTDVHRPAPKLDSATTRVEGAGTFVEYAWVREVTADFRYICGDGKRATGRAVGWTVDGSGTLECSTPIPDAKTGEPAPEAARLSCGPNSPAARAKRA
ncbi:hypothetical protein [Streptomyces sp. NK15101]|uniref:hypothetical protein n=1 Tax=Streptomyces sp. NK15101 TaxID=2873261 RepID=UPI001CEC9CA9|nr:hypothetical protein [Streptomyces sp. NK15101]